MARQNRDVEVCRTFWKMFARDASCPWALRVYVVNQLAQSAKMPIDFPPIPGTGSRNKAIDPTPGISAEAPTEVDVAATEAVSDVKHFLKQLGGANGDPQT